jgi:hypothetical protein
MHKENGLFKLLFLYIHEVNILFWDLSVGDPMEKKLSYK